MIAMILCVRCGVQQRSNQEPYLSSHLRVLEHQDAQSGKQVQMQLRDDSVNCDGPIMLLLGNQLPPFSSKLCLYLPYVTTHILPSYTVKNAFSFLGFVVVFSLPSSVS